MSFKVIRPEHTYCYKYGIGDYPALKKAMSEAFKPFHDHIQNKAYWNDHMISWAEYKSRDGFIPYSHNCGGIQLKVAIPSYYARDILPKECITECADYDEKTHDLVPAGEDHECDDNCDHYLKVWFKFEGIDDKGIGSFYLVASAGNEDAPYFRTIPTIFEHSFDAKNVADFKVKAKKAVSKLRKVMS